VTVPDHEQSAIAQAERVPEIARQSEEERQIHRHGRQQPEVGDLCGSRLHLILQHE